MSGRVDVELSLRNNGVKAVAYKRSRAGRQERGPPEEASIKETMKRVIPALFPN